MDKWQRRTVYYVVLLTGSMLVFAVLYQNGMRIYEGRPRTFLHSVQIVVETFTTTGFGSDSPWTSPQMNVLVIVMDLFGTVLIFMAFPVLAFPLLEDILSTTVPTAVDDLDDHVVICTYTPRADILIDELESRDVDYVIVEPDRDRATRLYEDGYRIIRADPESTSGLEGANLAAARALVADVSDQVDASIVLTARELADDVLTLSVVEEPDRAAYHRLAGADEVLSPRPLLGQSLASKVTTSVTSALDDVVEITDEFEIAEFPIHRGSQLVGKTLAESGIREQAGVNVIGAWFRGEFETPPDPETTLTNSTVLLATGREAQLERLRDLTQSGMRPIDRGDTIVVGYGEVGRTVTDALADAGLPYTVVDRTDFEGVDVVGDASEPETLREAGIGDASTVILALPDDTTAEFTALVVRDSSADVEIIARVEESRSISKMYQAGADYVLALATVTGRMLASRILEDEDVLSLDQQVEVVRTPASELVGRTLGEARVRSESGCTVVGIERNGDVLSDIGPAVRVEDGDELIIAGTDDGVQRFTELYG
ncbi:TrkA family potassium uptake protein [Haloglomus irregulare]|uniref:TrkA family potassium uptake protein n=1 Tax=Haloglomus irregulare TaxID=2234134 RepID=A0A554NEA4_9EURY|nr:NAD-binding protein [Haloglomus irregulare]TSD15320.1 TrkA family potassium uptake protein [Haloglomus irregulare]